LRLLGRQLKITVVRVLELLLSLIASAQNEPAAADPDGDCLACHNNKES